MWTYVEHGLARIEGFYDGSSPAPNNTAISSDILNYFNNCFSLKAHVEADPQLPAAVQAAVQAFFNGSTPLNMARDVANTYKHHTRGNPSAKQANISEVAMGEAPSATVRWTVRATGNSGALVSCALSSCDKS